jgi:hypothetical protein
MANDKFELLPLPEIIILLLLSFQRFANACASKSATASSHLSNREISRAVKPWNMLSKVKRKKKKRKEGRAGLEPCEGVTNGN